MSQDITEILDTLKSSDSQKKIYNTLLHINSHIITTHDGLKSFKENAGVTVVTQYLSKPNEKILNISLGILAKCCSDEECRSKIVSNGALKSLLTIMKFINQDVIYYRCCKLIGNLARDSDSCSVLISKDICGLLSPILQGKPSVGTQLVAVRCLNHIWTGASVTERKRIVRSDVLRSSLQYLDSGNKDVQKLVLRILFCISRSRFDRILKELITDEVLKQIISKTSEYSSIVLRIIYYLSEFRFFHFKLVKAGVLESILSHLRGMNLTVVEPTKEANTELALRALYRVSAEPQCRERLGCIPDAFDTLMDIIENSTHVKFKKFSVLVLSSYLYNNYLLKKLVKQRLILALIGYVRVIIETEGEVHKKEDLKYDTVVFPSSPVSSGGMSPLSDSEISITSLSYSPSSEYFTASPTLSLDSVYSPVCSPAIDDLDDYPEDDIDKMSDICSSVAESPLVFQEDEIVAKSLTEEKIFNLLKQLTFTHEPYFDLCSQRTWETLLDYLMLVRKCPNILTSVLSSIAGNPTFFTELLKSQFALKVHRQLCRPVHIDCSCCHEMFRCGKEILAKYSEVAESLYGDQILRDELEKKKNIDEVKLALTIPLIVQNVIRLEEYSLRRFKILNIIMNSLNEDADVNQSLFEEKVACLHSLAKNVYLRNPQIPCNICKKCDIASSKKETTIYFKLDDDGVVSANKHSICEKSEFFEAMFRCGFKEARESEVRLSNISSDCLTALFRLLDSYCECILPKNIVTLLELVVQSDRFLIPSLSDKLLNITMNNRLDYKNAHVIYDWAVENGSFLPSSSEWPICRNIIKYALVEKLTFNQREYMLRMLLKSRYKDRVLSDISQILQQQLTCKDVKMKSSMRYINQELAAKRQKLC